jgi:myosin heavy subunit
MSRCVKYNNQITQIKKSIREKEHQKLFNEKIDSQVKSSTSLLEKQGENLDLSKKLSLESESIASNTMVVLRNQRNQLQKSKTNAKEINENISKSNRAINSMTRHSMTNKLIMVLIIFLLILSILLIGFIKLTT